MEETTLSALEQASQSVSQVGEELSEAVSDAVSNNPVINVIKDMFKISDDMTISSAMLSLLPKIFLAVITIVIGVIIAKYLSKITIKAMKKKGVDPSVYSFINAIIKFIVYIITILSALSGLGLSVSSFVAALASVGVALGLGLQNSVSQLVSGIIIIINRPFKKGDFIEIKGINGCVTDIHIMHTVLHTLDNKKIILPNSDVTSNYIINYSSEPTRRCDLTFSISYGADIAKAKEVLLQVAGNNQYVLDEPAAMAAVNAHKDSCIELLLRCWCDTDNYWNLYFSLQEEVKIAFDENGITIPFNQLDININQQA